MLLAAAARLRAAQPLAYALPGLVGAGRAYGAGAWRRTQNVFSAPAPAPLPYPAAAAAARGIWTSRPACNDSGGGASPTSRRYSERKLIGYTPAQIYSVVADVAHYADFVPWCVRSTIIEPEGEGEEDGDKQPSSSQPPPPPGAGTPWPPESTTLEAELEVGFRAFSERYTSVVTLRPGGLHSDAAASADPAAAAAAAAASPPTITSTVRGSTLFHHLDCTWAFAPGPAPGTSWLTFGIAFEFKSPLYRAVAASFFDEVVRRMVAAFEGSAALSQGLAAALAPGGPSAFGWGGKEKGGRAKTTATVTATKRRPFTPGARGGRSSAPTASTTHQTGASSPPAGVRKAPSIAGGRRTRPSSDTRAAPSIDRLRGGAAFPWWPFGAGAGGGASGGGTGGGTANPADEERILISEIVLTGVEDDPAVARAATSALPLRPNFAYTLSEVQEGVRRVFDTGYFTAASPKAEDTRDGVKLTVELAPYPRLKRVIVTGADALPARVIEDALAPSAGRTINFHALRSALDAANAWYGERGIPTRLAVLADREDGVLELGASEATVAALNLRFVDRETGEVRPQGGYTKPSVILRQLATTPGRVYSARQAKADLDAVYATGLFEDVNLVPQAAAKTGEDGDGGNNPPPSPSSNPFDAPPGGPAPSVDVTVTLVERKTGGASAGGGISASGAAGDGTLPGFIGSASFSQRNVFGSGQKLAATAEVGQVDKLFRLHHTDPWLAGDPHRTSRTISLQNTRATGAPTHGRALDDAPPGGASSTGDGAAVVVARLTGGVEYSRPLAVGWTGTLGAAWQRARCVDEHGRGLVTDAHGGPLSFAAARAAGVVEGTGISAPSPPPPSSDSDTVATALVRVAYAGTSGEALASLEQALPLAPTWLNFNRARVRAERRASLAAIGLPRWTATASARAGAVIGDLPPYEAFPLGGTNSVRGYGEGALGTGRAFAEATAEILFPLPGAGGGVEGAIFADYGSDLGSGPAVPGDPAGARGKPGAGAGVGVGVRVDSPVGPLRLECALSDRGARRFHLGIGSHG